MLAFTSMTTTGLRTVELGRTGMRITVNQLTHFTIPLVFGALGSVAGFAAVFFANAGFLVFGGYMSLRQHGKS